jgi:hypothetical protein
MKFRFKVRLVGSAFLAGILLLLSCLAALDHLLASLNDMFDPASMRLIVIASYALGLFCLMGLLIGSGVLCMEHSTRREALQLVAGMMVMLGFTFYLLSGVYYFMYFLGRHVLFSVERLYSV